MEHFFGIHTFTNQNPFFPSVLKFLIIFLFQYSICKVFQDGGKDSVLWSMMFLVLGGIQFLANAVQVSFTLTLKALIVKLYIDYKFKLVLVTLILSNWFNFYLFTR